MSDTRVRIVDIADALGLSTATVSNVIHGKTKKISAETVKRVQALLEEKQYIPSMAGILLAQNDSRIIGVVVNNHAKYEGHVLEDAFIASSLNALSAETDRAGYFMMVKAASDWREISRFASMWNMEGLVLIGFCDQDYQSLRNAMHIPFVVYDGYFTNAANISNIIVDNLEGGILAGNYLLRHGHRKVLCISDNNVCMDQERYQGLKQILPQAELMVIPMEREKRSRFYQRHFSFIREHTAIFAVSDYYAADMLQFLRGKNVAVPDDISVIGFDDASFGAFLQPALTTIRQDTGERAREALRLLKELKEHNESGTTVKIKVTFVERESAGPCRR